MAFHGSSFWRYPFTAQSNDENRPPQTPKLPPRTGARALMAERDPTKRSPCLASEWRVARVTSVTRQTRKTRETREASESRKTRETTVTRWRITEDTAKLWLSKYGERQGKKHSRQRRPCTATSYAADTHSRTIPGTLDTVPDTTADRAHRERTAKVVEDDIGAERGERKFIAIEDEEG
ncbi:hypothetical protein JCM24511_06495 [Saitozyma sp. JCM 24511]|nr:hypothetical protein JCM24511_06495 [Saitozyma sp. JCM 24511]